MTSKTRRMRWLSVFVLILTLVMGASQVLAVDNKGLFELDSNALNDAAKAGDDWNSLPGGALATTTIPIADPTGSSIFTTGGSKDDLNVPNWRHTGGSVPDKDEITNAYAAAYNSNNQLILYFGADRYANNGDAALGFWFFKSKVSLNPNGTFNGTHSVGDLLILSHFSNGGSISTIQVYEWVGTGGTATANGTLQLRVSGSNCVPNDGPVNACAVVNAGNATAPWDYTPKQGSAGTFPKNSFFEGGLNVTAALGSTPCFSTFLAETRSSTSVDAQLKDFTLGQFPLCGANIEIGPDAVNKVGDPHTFTVNVNQTVAGSSTPAANGTIVDVTLTDSNGAINSISSNTCASPGTVNGQCTVTFTSNTAGIVTGHAEADVVIGGDIISVATDGVGDNSDDAVKRFVDAKISITPDGVNEVNDPHTFTVLVEQNDGLAANAAGGDAANGFGPAAGAKPTVSLTDSNGAINNISSNSCANPGTDGDGKCSVTFSSSSPGTVTGHASVTLKFANPGNTPDPLEVTRDTDAQGSNSSDAVKRFADAFITIAPDGVNNINDPHTFTVTVKQHAGTQPSSNPADYVNAPDGTIVTVTLTPTEGAQNPVPVSSNTCATGTVGGQCAVTFNSNTPGIITGHASVSLTFNFPGGNPASIQLTRETDGQGNNSDDAVKIYVGGSLTWVKHDNAGRLLPGATFEVCRTHDFNLQTQAMDPLTTPACFSVADDSAAPAGDPGSGADEDAVGGQFKLSLLALGRYTITETIAPPGYVAGNNPVQLTANLTFADPDADLTTTPFVNNRPTVKLTGFGYTNDAVGTPTDGVVTGTTTYTVKLKNYGAAATTLTAGTLSVTATGQGSGNYTCAPVSCSQAISGTLAPGQELTFTLTINYTNFADGAKVTASLTAVEYTTNGLARSASGTPAEVFFTVQAD